MIPLSLSLSNFLCYRDGTPSLSLEGVRMACLTGDNGAGKSALLDSMTWALWGQSRCQSDVDLISIGESEMRVEYTFRLDGGDYRVTRRVQRGALRKGGGTSAQRTWLDLHGLDAEGVWRSQSGDGVRDTQQRIIDLLKMDYDTFINSAFLLQGRADEFTTKPPGERKRVLADILGLSVYDELEKAARERARTHADTLRGLDDDVRRLRLVVDDEPVFLEQEAEHARTLEQSSFELGQLARDVDGCSRQVLELDQQDQQLRAIETQVQQNAMLLRQVETQSASAESAIAGLTELVARRDEIEAQARRLTAARERRTTLDAALRSLRALDQQRNQTERALDREREALIHQQRDLTRRLTELEALARNRPTLEVQREKLAQAATTATRLVGDIDRCREQQRDLVARAAELSGANTHLKERMDGLAERIRTLMAADAVCPVCNRPLGDDERRHAIDEDKRAGQQLKEQYLLNKAGAVSLTEQAAQMERQAVDLGLQRDRAELEARKEARVAEQLEQARRAGDEQVVVHSSLVELTERLQGDAYGGEQRATLVGIDQQIALLAYDEAAHQAAADDERHLAQYAELATALRDADERLPAEQQRLVELSEMVADLRQRAARDLAAAERLREQVRQLPVLRTQLAELNARIDACRGRRAEVERALGGVQVQLARCRQARVDLATAEVEWRRVTEERELALELVEAFGRKGLQAMIIETVVPELQDEANALLDRMSGNSMRVEFRTQLQNKSGETRETLDIVIRDEVGERRYENYSGGEQFRVNFAIRVALSKLLTRRSGAQLQMLVVDEGFGTQDARGRDGLIEAIRSVESIFSTVLVISHLTDIRDEFPTQIVVSKGPLGSTVAVR